MKSTTDIQMSKMPGNSFNDIYTSYYKKSFFFAKSYVHNDLAAEDIASEALIKLWEKLKAEPVEEKYILPLLLAILKNKALDYLKHEEVKRSAFEVMADWQQQELSIRMSALEACNKGGGISYIKSIESTAGDFKRLSSFILFLLLLLSLTGWGYGCF